MTPSTTALSTIPSNKPACVDKKPGSICSAGRGAFRIAHLIEPSQANAETGDDKIASVIAVMILFIHARQAPFSVGLSKIIVKQSPARGSTIPTQARFAQSPPLPHSAHPAQAQLRRDPRFEFFLRMELRRLRESCVPPRTSSQLQARPGNETYSPPRSPAE